MKDQKDNKSKTCPSCIGNLVEGETTFTVDFSIGVVVIRNVPATVCSQCGMEWLDDSITDKIENIVKEAKGKHSVVEVMSLTA
mgnify:CR=1 FL=1